MNQDQDMLTPQEHHVYILNQTCLAAIEKLDGWERSLRVTVHADRSLATLPAAEIDPLLATADAVVLPAAHRPLTTAGEMARFPSVKILGIAASGYEWMDLDAATRHGIVVTNAPTREGAEVVADHTFALMLAVARQLPYHHRQLQEGHDARGIGTAVWGKTIGIVGLGSIGKAVACRARGFDMRIIATTRHPDHEFNRRYGIEIMPLTPLLQKSDIISLHLRLTDATQETLGQDELALLKKDAIVVNTARPQLVDGEALAAALLDGRLGGAGLDDPTSAHPAILQLPNVVCTPHLGNRAWEGMVSVVRAVLTDADKVLNGERPAHLLNPEVYDTPQLRAPLQ